MTERLRPPLQAFSVILNIMFASAVQNAFQQTTETNYISIIYYNFTESR